MKLIFSFFLFILVLVSSSYAFDCDYFTGYDKQECISLKQANEDLIPSMIYDQSFKANHEFIKNYNDNIIINSNPNNTQDSGVIRDAWLKLLTISPSILYKDQLFVPEDVEVRSEYSYRIQLPPNVNEPRSSTCRKIYSLDSKSETFNILVGGKKRGEEKITNLVINQNSTIKAKLDVNTVTREEIYHLRKYCCSRGEDGCEGYCYSCDHSNTNYIKDNINLEESVGVFKYINNPVMDFEFIAEYYDSSKGIFTKSDNVNIELSFINSFYRVQDYTFVAEFINEPFYFLQLKALNSNLETQTNIIRDNNTIYVKDTEDCKLTYSDFFTSEEKECDYEYTGEEIKEIEPTKMTDKWKFVVMFAVFIFVIYLIYVAINKTWGKVLLPIVLILLLMPSGLALEGEEEINCGITNLASCIPAKIYDFFIGVLNAPLAPFIYLTRTLLETAPSVNLFIGLWAIMVYLISLFYGFLFIYSGFQFIISGHDVIKRAMAKEWLKNTVIMIVLIQASFYLYEFAIELGSTMATSVLSMVNEHFFMITADNIVNIGLEFVFVSVYLLVLLFTVLFLVMRYLVVCFGVLFVPIGVFCYFVPPLRSYGKLILNLLGMFIFITFLDAIIILGCSLMIDIPLFENFKILIMIACFSIINLLFIILTKHVIKKSTVGESGEKVAQAVKYIAMFA